MKTVILIYGSLVVFLALLCFPITADAFSRRSHGSEVTQSQTVTAPVKPATVYNGDGSPTAVPEPPVLLLMSLGVGLFALCSALMGFRKQS